MRKESSVRVALSISEFKRIETSVSFGSFIDLLFCKDLTNSSSVDDFPHITSSQGDWDSIAKQKKNDHNYKLL